MSPLQITYIAAALLLAITFVIERKITVLDLIIAAVILALPYANVAIFAVNIIAVLNYLGVINLKSTLQKIVNFLNLRVK